MSGQETADADRRAGAPTLTDNELRATMYFAVGVASEGSSRGRNVAYEISFAGYVHREGDTSRHAPIEAGTFRDNQLEPIYNSGYSIGTLQTDFGQQRNDPHRNADQLLNAYQGWAQAQVDQHPELVLTQSEYDEASRGLRQQGNEIRGDRRSTADNAYDIRPEIKTRLNAFMASDAGITYVHNQDVTQVDHLLRQGGAVRQLQDTTMYQNATPDDQVRMATVLAKLENQDGARHWPAIVRGINDGSIDSLEGIKAGVPQSLRGDRDNALRGAEVIIALRNAEGRNPLNAAWQDVVANPLVNPTQLTQNRAHPNLDAEYSTVKNLFLIPAQSTAFVHALDDGGHRTQEVHFQGAPREQTAGLYVSGNDFVQWNRDGHGYANIDGQWNEIERSQITRTDHGRGIVDLDIDRGGATERLLHVDPNAAVLRPIEPAAVRPPPTPIAQPNWGPFAPNSSLTPASVAMPTDIGGAPVTGDERQRASIGDGPRSNAIPVSATPDSERALPNRPQPTDDRHDDREHPGQDVVPGSAATPRASGQPPRGDRAANDDPMLQQARTAVGRLDGTLGRTFDDASERMSASLTVLAREQGLQRIDEVVLNNKTSTLCAGENVFVVQGSRDDPAHLRAQMPTATAAATPVAESLARLETQQRQASSQTLAAPEQEQSQRQVRSV